MSFIQDIFSVVKFKKYLNTTGKVLTTDATGLLILVDVATSKQSVKNQTNIFPSSDPPYVLFTDSTNTQISNSAIYSVELIPSGGVGVDMTGQVQRIGSERRVYGIPSDSNFTLTINYI